MAESHVSYEDGMAGEWRTMSSERLRDWMAADEMTGDPSEDEDAGDGCMQDSEREAASWLQDSEREAAAWLQEHPAADSDTAALFSSCLNLPYMADSDKQCDAHTQYVSNCEHQLYLAFSVNGQGEELLPLPSVQTECACADLNRLALRRVHLSGSVREGTDVRLFLSNVSDTDVMFQVGPVTVWAEPSQWQGEIGGLPPPPTAAARTNDKCREQRAEDRGHGTQDRETSPPLPSPPLVTVQATEQPGYVLLRHRRRPDCLHSDTLPLSGSSVVKLIESLTVVLTPESSDHTGPSVAAVFRDFIFDPRSMDLVACVACPSWPCEDFESRPRPSGQPVAELVRRLCRTPAFLVPVGYPGSTTEQHQWRLSFSRHEYITYRSMTETQRAVLSMLKHCRAVVGKSAKPLKSYYLKTALMWLCEERPAVDWSRHNFHASLLSVLRYVEVCVRHGFMPLYFWPVVNLLSGRGSAELAALRSAVVELRGRLESASLAMVSQWMGVPVAKLAPRLLLAGQVITDIECVVGAVFSVAGDIVRSTPRWLDSFRMLAFNAKLGPWKRLLPFSLCGSHKQVLTNMLTKFTHCVQSEDRAKEAWLEAFTLLFPGARVMRDEKVLEDSWLVEE